VVEQQIELFIMIKTDNRSMPMQTQIFNSYSEFLEREDRAVNGVSHTYAEAFPGGIK